MNVLVIGGNGFIGSHLIDFLLAKGHKVRVLDYQYELFRAPNKLVDYRISGLSNYTEIESSLDGIDIVFHMASVSVPSNSNEKAIFEIDNVLVPTIRLLELLVKNKIPRIVYFSSGGAVYGINDGQPIKEESSLFPISSYGIIKTTMEFYLSLYERNFGLQPLIIRPSNPYGPRQNNTVNQGVISTFLRKINSEAEISIFGNMLAQKDYIYINDLIEICCGLVAKEAQGIYNIGSGVGTSLDQILKTVIDVTGIEPQVKYSESFSSDVANFILDSDKAYSKSSVLPKTNLQSGVLSTWNWIKSLDFVACP